MKIAVFFPGIGYHCDKPLLYYSRGIVRELGYDKIVNLTYSYEGGNIRGDAGKMKQAFEILYAQAKESLKDIDFGRYDEILFVSKSVGTIIASAYAHEYSIKCRQVLYTPLEYTFEYPHEDACAFIGTADPWSDVNTVLKLADADKVPVFHYDGLNHSLEGDDTIENMNTLKKIMDITKDFLMKSNNVYIGE